MRSIELELARKSFEEEIFEAGSVEEGEAAGKGGEANGDGEKAGKGLGQDAGKEGKDKLSSSDAEKEGKLHPHS